MQGRWALLCCSARLLTHPHMPVPPAPPPPPPVLTSCCPCVSTEPQEYLRASLLPRAVALWMSVHLLTDSNNGFALTAPLVMHAGFKADDAFGCKVHPQLSLVPRLLVCKAIVCSRALLSISQICLSLAWFISLVLGHRLSF